LAAIGVVVLAAGRPDVGVIAAFAILAGAGVLGWLLHGHERILMVVWTAAALFSVGALGGITGPGVVWILLPVAAGTVLGRSWVERAACAVLAACVVAAAQAAAVTAGNPGGLAGGMTALAACATMIWAFVSAGRLQAVHARPLTVVDHREAERARALAVELHAARAEIEHLRSTGSASTEARDELHSEAVALRSEVEILTAQVEQADARRTEADAANQAKSRFLATMSHELRTPLNAVMGFADIMRNRLFGPLPDRYAEYSQLIHESGAHLLDLINDVLDLSKIEADRYRLEHERFDAREAVESVVKLVRTQADEAGVILDVRLPDRSLPVEADKRAVKQIALNLLANAFKFTPAGGDVRLSLEEVDGALELVVSDTGIGIAQEDLERLGRPYEQAGDADTRALGTGLGLSLVRAFAGLHSGTMTLESTLGEGTAVTVRLPVLAPEADLFVEDSGTAQVIPFIGR
jgi:cell cycle sensor histidine kinase DivJ